jgi:hypothetical protein
VIGQRDPSLVVPGKVPFAVGRSNRIAAGIFAAGLGDQYAAYGMSPIYRNEVILANATIIDAPATLTCTMLEYSC